jgi:hypothetical protein
VGRAGRRCDDWFDGLPRPAGSASAAAFDTRAGFRLAGGAAKGIAKRLRQHGYRILAAEGYIITDSTGPLRDGEIERAREWGASLPSRIAA